MTFDAYYPTARIRIALPTGVKLVRGAYLRWPTLDVDLELTALDHPASYPLVYQG